MSTILPSWPRLLTGAAPPPYPFDPDRHRRSRASGPLAPAPGGGLFVAGLDSGSIWYAGPPEHDDRLGAKAAAVAAERVGAAPATEPKASGVPVRTAAQGPG